MKNRGCSGLAYHLEYVDKAGRFDEAVEQDGVKVLIDSKALFSIIGSEMDWVEDKLNQRFVFRNPNISKSTLHANSTVTGMLINNQRSNVVVVNHSWSSIALNSMYSMERFSGIRTRSNGSTTLRISRQNGASMLQNSKSTTLRARNPQPSPSKYVRLIIHTSHLLHKTFQTALELLVRRILLEIVFPVLLGLEAHHETILVHRLNTPHHFY